MPRCIAFLRAVNVGGRFIKMEALRIAFEALGLDAVETFIASGNVIFMTRARDLAALERKVEAHLQRSFGFEVHTFIRTEAELAAIVALEAFDAADAAAARTHVVGFLAVPLDTAGVQACRHTGSSSIPPIDSIFANASSTGSRPTARPKRPSRTPRSNAHCAPARPSATSAPCAS